MKRMFLVLMALLLFTGMAMAEEIRSGLYEFELSITSGTTTQFNNTATPSGISWFNIDGGDSVLDLSLIKPSEFKWNMTPYVIQYALSNTGKVTLDSGNASGATYTVYYQQSGVDDDGVWAKAGVTAIAAAIAIESGNSREGQPFTPEFNKYYKFGILTGMTPFRYFRAKLIVQ